MTRLLLKVPPEVVVPVKGMVTVPLYPPAGRKLMLEIRGVEVR